MDGLLLVDKPAGWTSHDVVARVRRLLSETAGHKVKVGHTGTLDPMATGLLILVVGQYTKRAEQFSKLDKVYEAELTLGATSTTGDSEGELSQKSTQRPPVAAVQTALNTFLGEISQIPPPYSAVKIGGQRAYKLARAGKTVEIRPRQVHIHSIEAVQYDYPKLFFKVHVSSGTYIRSLAADIGEQLGTGAYLSSLRRTQVGRFDVSNAQGMDCLQELKLLQN